MRVETIVIANDHGGVEYKNKIIDAVNKLYPNITIENLGADSPASVDYPDYAHQLASRIKDLGDDRAAGILICGTGIGISIAANRHKHIRAALCHDVTTSRLTREHNDANVLVLGQRVIGEQVALDCVKVFLETEFEGGRHQGRVDKINPTN